MAYLGLRQILGPVAYHKIKEVRGREYLPPRPPFIVAANHVGFLDAPALVMFIWHTYKRLTHYITKRIFWKLWGGPVARHWIGMIPLNSDRKADSLNEAMQVIRQGEIVGVFPEGTRNPDPHFLLKGKTGAVRMALATGVPLIPVGIINTTGHYFGTVLRNIFNKNRFAVISIGQPLDLSEFRGKPVDKPLLESATRKLMKAIGELCNKEYTY